MLLKKVPDFDKDRIALLCIDIQKVYDVDDKDASFEDWSAWNFKEVGKNATRVLHACRKKGYPILHAALCLDEHTVHPYDEVDKDGKPIYSVKGTVGAEIIDSMKPLEGEIYFEKQRFSGFFQTNLDLLLRKLRVDHLIMIGGFTDACLLTTAYDAWARDYTMSFVKDAITAGSEGAHKACMLVLANWIYACSIYDTEEFEKALEGKEHSAWYWEQCDSFRFTCDNIDEMYQKLR